MRPLSCAILAGPPTRAQQCCRMPSRMSGTKIGRQSRFGRIKKIKNTGHLHSGSKRANEASKPQSNENKGLCGSETPGGTRVARRQTQQSGSCLLSCGPGVQLPPCPSSQGQCIWCSHFPHCQLGCRCCNSGRGASAVPPLSQPQRRPACLNAAVSTARLQSCVLLTS